MTGGAGTPQPDECAVGDGDHSPLVVVSVEPRFDLRQDRLWDLDLNPETRRVELTPQHFARLGDVNCWLRSEAFDQYDVGSLWRRPSRKRGAPLTEERELQSH